MIVRRGRKAVLGALALVVATGVGSAQAGVAPARVPGAHAGVAAAAVAPAPSADPVIEPPALGGVEANAPRRAYDSRTSTPLRAGETRRVKVRPDADPASWAGAWVNITVTRPTASGFITVWSGEGDRPTASTANFTAGRTVPNVATVALTSTGELAVHNGSSGTTHVIVDVLARVGDGAAVAPGSMRPVTPFRALDTRLTKVKVPASGFVDVTVAGRGGVPSTASGVILNVTVVSPVRAGWATVFSPAEPRPDTSAANWVAGLTRATTTMSKLEGGQVRLFNGGSVATDFLVDVNGWIVAGSTAQRPTAVTLATPKRLIDTRTLGIVGPGGYVDVPPNQPGLHFPIYSVTTTGATGDGYLTIANSWSSLTNYRPEGATTSFAVVGNNASKPWLQLVNRSRASVHVVVDLIGWVGPDLWLGGTLRSDSGTPVSGVNVALAAPSLTPGRFGPTVQPSLSGTDGRWTFHGSLGEAYPVCAVQPRTSQDIDLRWAPACLGGSVSNPQRLEFPVGSRALALDLTMTEGGAVTATLQQSSTAKLGRYILARNVATGGQFVVLTGDALGRIVVDGLEGGDYLVLIYDTEENYQFEWVGGLQAGTLSTADLLAKGAHTVHVSPRQRTELGTRTLALGGRVVAMVSPSSTAQGASLYKEDGTRLFGRQFLAGKVEFGGLRTGQYYLCHTTPCVPLEDGLGPISVTAGETTTVEVPAP